MDADARVKTLYSIMQSIENKLGGGEGVEGLYGSINKGGMSKIIKAMRSSCGLDSSSRLVDIGAGLGRPLVHALIEPGIQSALGVEIDRIKCDKAVAFLRQTANELQRRGVCKENALTIPEINCSSIEQIKTLDPCTHAYSFWEGVPFDGKMAFGRLFAASRTLRSVTVVQRAMRGEGPADAMAELGFGDLVLVDAFSVSMSGSGRSFTAYVFNRADHMAHLPAPLAAEAVLAESVATPARSHEAHPPPCMPADSSSLSSAATDSSVAMGAVGGRPWEGGGQVDTPAAQQQPQEAPVLGRGSRQLLRRRKAAEAAAAAAAEASAGQSAQQAEVRPRRQRVRAAAGGKAAQQAAATAAHTVTGVAEGKTEAKACAARQAATGSPRKAGSPQQLRGVQKKQSPAKKATRSLLQDARIRKPRAAASQPATGVKVQAKTKGLQAASVASPEAAPRAHPPARRGLLA